MTPALTFRLQRILQEHPDLADTVATDLPDRPEAIARLNALSEQDLTQEELLAAVRGALIEFFYVDMRKTIETGDVALLKVDDTDAGTSMVFSLGLSAQVGFELAMVASATTTAEWSHMGPMVEIAQQLGNLTAFTEKFRESAEVQDLPFHVVESTAGDCLWVYQDILEAVYPLSPDIPVLQLLFGDETPMLKPTTH